MGNLKELVNIFGPMVIFSKVDLLIINFKDMAYFSIQMVINMRVVFLKVKNMDKANLNGLMVENLLGLGKMESNMVKEFILIKKEKLKKEYGKWEKELNQSNEKFVALNIFNFFIFMYPKINFYISNININIFF